MKYSCNVLKSWKKIKWGIYPSTVPLLLSILFNKFYHQSYINTFICLLRAKTYLPLQDGKRKKSMYCGLLFPFFSCQTTKECCSILDVPSWGGICFTRMALLYIISFALLNNSPSYFHHTFTSKPTFKAMNRFTDKSGLDFQIAKDPKTVYANLYLLSLLSINSQ